MPGNQTTSLAWERLPDLAPESFGPRHARLAEGIREAVRTGRLPAGTALPASRTMAGLLGCSRWVVTEAYAQLTAEGYLEARAGSATRVSAAIAEPQPPDPVRSPTRWLMWDLSAGIADVRAFPRTRWAQAVRVALAEAAVTELVAPAAAGHIRLREALSAHLGRTRGIEISPRDLTVTHGVSDGLARLGRALTAGGATRLAVEDPGWPGLRTAAAQAGLTVIPVGVDADGLRVADLPGDVAAVVITPDHQFPTGVVLSAARRAALSAWAEATGSLIVEDGYDSELRYERARARGTTDPAWTARLGTVSKTLSPGLGLGWLVTPSAWTARVTAANAGMPAPSVVDQLALLEFLERGWYDRHLRWARQRYRDRRAALVDRLAAGMPGYAAAGAGVGLHLLLRLPPGSTVADASALVRAAAAREVVVADVARYCLDPANAAPALVIGLGNVADTAIPDAAAQLVAAGRPSAG